MNISFFVLSFLAFFLRLVFPPSPSLEKVHSYHTRRNTGTNCRTPQEPAFHVHFSFVVRFPIERRAKDAVPVSAGVAMIVLW
jgi:hypothetical protein